MSVCAAPAKRTKKVFTVPARTPLVPSAVKYEFCEGGSTVVIPSTPGAPVVTTICCPQPGPQGPAGPAGGGLKYLGAWTTGTEYFFESGDPQSTSVVKYKDVVYVCLAPHSADAASEPGLGADWQTKWDVFGEVRRLRWTGDWTDSYQYYISDVVRSLDGNMYISKTALLSGTDSEPGFGANWEANWDLFSSSAGGFANQEDQSFFDQLKDNVFDWMKNATVGDWIQALAVGVGVVWAGTKIVESITSSGQGDGQADSRYNGSAAYTGTLASPTLPVVVGSLMEFAGFASNAYDVSLLPSTTLNFAISGSINVRTILNQLALAYQFDIITAGSVVKFVPKYQAVSRSLTADDLGHVKDSTTGGVKYAAKRMQGIDLPRSVTVKYYSSSIDQNAFTQTSTLATYNEGQDAMLDVPFTLTDAQAKSITETVLINAHIEQQQYTFTTDYYNVDLEPSDVVSIPLDSGGTTQVRIIEITETDDGLLEFTTTRCDYNSYSYVASGSNVVVPPTQPTQVITSIGYSDTLFLEVPPLSDEDAAAPRIKALIHGYNRAGWPGADVFRSIDGGNSYDKLASSSAISTFGLVVTAIAAPTDYRIWDTTTTISVKVKQGTLLTAASDLAVLNGENWCMVGQEVIGFVNATLTGVDSGMNVYSLSRLVRGRAGTEVHVGTHQANELFVVLDSTLVDIPLTIADLGKSVKCKTVTYGSDISKVAAVDIQPFGLNMRPWAPALFNAVRQVNNDWVLTWIERPRANNDLRDYTEISHDADYAGFAYAIMSGPTIKRSGTTTDITFTYTAAMQVTDFGSVQANLNASVTQMSTLLGGGQPAIVNI